MLSQPHLFDQHGHLIHAPALFMRLRLIPGLLLATILAGCQPASPPAPFISSIGTIVTNDPLILAPDRGWRSDAELGLWSLERTAGIACFVTEPGFDTLRVQLRPAPPAVGRWLLRWDRDVIEDTISVVDDVMFISIPAAALTPGTHHLVLERPATRSVQQTTPAASADTDGAALPVVWSHLGYDYAGSFRPFAAKELLRYQFLSDFMLHGVTSSGGSEKLGGVVFDGPQRLTQALPVGGGRLTARVQNGSHGGATFRVIFDQGTTGHYWLEPHAHHTIDLEVPSGARTVTLSTVGERNGLFIWSAPHFEGRQERTQPPVLLITLDTTRRDSLSPYGASALDTPILDQFARTATVFERAYTTAPWTLPAHASIFTGLYPERHGAGVADRWLDRSHRTLAEHLRPTGYVTAGYVGGLLSTYRYGLAQGFDFYVGPEGLDLPGDVLEERVRTTMGIYRDQPFFLFINLFDPHFPYEARAGAPAFANLTGLREAVSSDSGWSDILDGSSQSWARLVHGDLEVDPAGLRALRAAYRTEVTATDAQLGRLLDALRHIGQFDETLIIVTADHGELLGEGGYFSHASRLDPELMEIPMLIKWPFQTTEHRVDDVVSLVDLFPTVLTAASVPVPHQQGVALRQAGGGAAARRSFIRFEEHESNLHPLVPNMKLGENVVGIQGATFRRLLWQHGDRCHQLRRRQWHVLECPPLSYEERTLASLSIPRDDQGDAPAEDRAQLRALGYMP